MIKSELRRDLIRHALNGEVKIRKSDGGIIK